MGYVTLLRVIVWGFSAWTKLHWLGLQIFRIKSCR